MDGGTTCCCCCKLKNGVVVLGVLSLIGGLATAIISGVAMSSCSQGANCSDTNGFNITSMIQSILTIVVACILLVGVHMMRPVFLFPYMVMITVNIAANVVIAIWLIVDWEAYAMGGYAIGILIGSAISCYFVYVVNLYRVQMISHLISLQRSTAVIGVVEHGVPPHHAVYPPGIQVQGQYPSPQSHYPSAAHHNQAFK